MKSIFLLMLCLTAVYELQAQYYYKDVIVPGQAAKQIQKYRQLKIRTVNLSSFESDGQPTENFKGSQSVDQQYSRLTTTLRSSLAGESVLISSFNESGTLVRTSDTTDGSGSTTEYFYGPDKKLARIVNVSNSAGNHQEKEEHIWQYADGRPTAMQRIKNNTDTTYITFVPDEKGNVAEENSIRKGKPQPSFFYYYDVQNRLTDIASYNIKAKRLLPDYIFEYNEDGSMKSMMVVPEGSSDYQKWYYEYNNGLKATETVFNKKKQLLGKIQYHYE